MYVEKDRQSDRQTDTGPFVEWFVPAVSASVNQIMYAERNKQSDRQTEIGPFLEWFVPAVSRLSTKLCMWRETVR